jgi:hypothetical protein
MPLWVRKAKIATSEREMFERYGEAVIAQVVAQIASPLQADLAEILGSREKRLAARDWLTERGDVAEWRARRDLALELLIILLIGLEIVLALWEGNKQATIFAQMNSSIGATASILKALETTQEQSLAELNKQLAILQEQEQGRLAALQRKPKLLIVAGGADLMNHAQNPKPCVPIPGRGDIAGCSIDIENHGELPFTNGRLRIWSDSTDAHFNGANIEAVQLLSVGLTGDGLELLLPPILKGEAPRLITVEVVLMRKRPVRLNLQIVGDGVDTTNLTPMEALPVEIAPSN